MDLPAALRSVRTAVLSDPKATVDLARAEDRRARAPKAVVTIDDRPAQADDLAPAEAAKADDLTPVAAETVDDLALADLTPGAVAKVAAPALAAAEVALAAAIVVQAPVARADAVASAEAEAVIVDPVLAPKAGKVTEVAAPNDLART